MSLQFSDTTTKRGIIQEIESECELNDGDISGNATLLKKFTAGVNLALDDFTRLAIKASGTWQFDDTNFGDSYPVIYSPLVAGQKDYPFTTDGEGNLILDIYKVMILPSATATEYVDITPCDTQSDENIGGLANESSVTGVPTIYDKSTNGIIVDPTPSYSVNRGIKLFVNREASYFNYEDTTKKPGVPGVFHRYFAIKPAADYARRHGLASANRLADEVLKYEGDESRRIIGSIERYFARREKDVRKAFGTKKIIYQ